MTLVDENLKLNGFDETKHTSITADVLQFLKEQTAVYDVIIIDPPAFAKSLSKRHNAFMAYKRLNAMAIQAVKSDGFIFTFSCSQVVSTQLFTDAVMAAAIEQNRNVRIVGRLTQGADHPVNIFHPEGHYLKGLILFVS
jgi:23S rRNA (cytosine1962-C5)-methyltransferase